MPEDITVLAPEEFESRLQSWLGKPLKPPGTLTESDASASMQPDMQEAVLAASRQFPVNVPMSEESARMGLREGVPFAGERGAPASVRAAMSFDKDTLNQYKLLNKVYGAGNVDLSDDGRFVVRNQVDPKTGLKEDFFVDPIGVDAGDIASLSSEVLPFIMAAVGARGLSGQATRPLGKYLGSLIGGSAGYEAQTALQQVGSRFGQGESFKPGELAYERAKASLADMALGGLLSLGVKGATKATQGALGLLGVELGTTVKGIPITSAPSKTVESARQLKERTGIDYPLSPGEASEAHILSRFEATAKPRFGSQGVMGEFEARKSAAEDELRRVHLGLPRKMSDEDLVNALPKADVTGQKVLGRLGTEALQLEGDVAKAKLNVQAIGTSEAQRTAGVSFGSTLEPTALGKSLRAKAAEDFAVHRKVFGDRYDEFFSKPEVMEQSVKGDSLAKGAREVEKDLTPSALKTSEVLDYDAYGNPIARDKKSVERLEAFIAAKTKSTLDELKGLQGALVSVRDLKQIRTAIDSNIAEGVAIPGVDVKQLVTLKEKVTDAITDALGSMEDKSLLRQWQTLNKDFATDRARFDKRTIKRMLIPEGEPGSIGNAQLARSVASGEPTALDAYNDFKSFYGAASPEFRGIQQLAREQVLKGAKQETTDFVSGADLRSRLRHLDPEVATDLFGTSKQELHRIGEALSVAQGNLDLNELSKLAGSKTLTAQAIPGLIAAEQARAKAWGNRLIRSAAKGSAIETEVIKPSEVARNITQLDPDDADHVLGILSDRPDLIEDVRRLAVEDLWGRVQAQLKSRTGVTSTLIEQALGTEVQRRTWQRLLGKNVVEDLELLSKVVRSQELGTRSFGSAGQMATTADVGRAERGGVLNIAFEAAERTLLAALYFGTAKKAITNIATKNDQGRFLNAVVTSTPFIEHVLEDYGPIEGVEIMGALRSIVEPKQKQEMLIRGQIKGQPDFRSMSKEQFDLWFRNNRMPSRASGTPDTP